PPCAGSHQEAYPHPARLPGPHHGGHACSFGSRSLSGSLGREGEGLRSQKSRRCSDQRQGRQAWQTHDDDDGERPHVDMRVCVIDGRGGGLGSRLVAGLQMELGQEHKLVALGTNSVAAAAMKEAGASQVRLAARAIAATVSTMHVIIASLNCVLPGAMLGEVTPEIVHAILGARAKKVLLPVNRVQVEIVRAGSCSLDALITQSVSRVRRLVNSVADV